MTKPPRKPQTHAYSTKAQMNHLVRKQEHLNNQANDSISSAQDMLDNLTELAQQSKQQREQSDDSSNE